MATEDFTAEELANEEWRPIEGFPHEVSNLGRVRRAAPGLHTFRGRLLRPNLCRYYRVMLYYRGKRATPMVHTLVAAAFHGPRPAGMEINHIDGVKTNNRSSNLEYCTPLENRRHASRLGLNPSGDRAGLRKHPERAPKGERNAAAKLSEDDVRQIRAEYGPRLSMVLARRYGVSRSAIYAIAHGETWKCVT